MPCWRALVARAVGLGARFSSLFAGGPLFMPNTSDNVPDAYLNYLLFDKDYVLVDAGYQAITEAALEHGTGTAHERLALEVVPAVEGYLYIYLSNESAQVTEVYFGLPVFSISSSLPVPSVFRKPHHQ